VLLVLLSAASLPRLVKRSYQYLELPACLIKFNLRRMCVRISYVIIFLSFFLLLKAESSSSSLAKISADKADIEFSALAQFFYETNGPHWKENEGWDCLLKNPWNCTHPCGSPNWYAFK
jgi:hypothetical protein